MKANEIEAGDFEFEWGLPIPKMQQPGKTVSKPDIKVKNSTFRFVRFEPGTKGGRHNHKEENMEEWHYIISGTGWCIVYGDKVEKTRLKPGMISPKFDSNSPDHEFIADDEPLLFLAISRHL